jgi:DNA-binding response OmpR family regulator
VILDLMMPEIDGFEVCRRLREKPDFAHVKITVVSNKAYEHDQRRARQLGADGYVVKPIRPETLLAEHRKFKRPLQADRPWGKPDSAA